MMRIKRNPPIYLEIEGVVLGYYYISAYMNLNQKFAKVNWQLDKKLAE